MDSVSGCLDWSTIRILAAISGFEATTLEAFGSGINPGARYKRSQAITPRNRK